MNERLPYLSSMLWFVLGGVAGAGISLLLAPQSGPRRTPKSGH
jgi:gas vesicle protein